MSELEKTEATGNNAAEIYGAGAESGPRPEVRIPHEEGFSHPRRVEWIRYGSDIATLTQRLQSVARKRIAELEIDAKRALEAVSRGVESRFRSHLSTGPLSTRERWLHLGRGLVTLGEKVQAFARHEKQ